MDEVWAFGDRSISDSEVAFGPSSGRAYSAFGDIMARPSFVLGSDSGLYRKDHPPHPTTQPKQTAARAQDGRLVLRLRAREASRA